MVGDLKMRGINYKQLYEKECFNCNEKFNTGRYLQIYCSADCKQEAFLKRAKAKYKSKKILIIEEKECKFCNKIFLKNTHNQVFCSKDCARNCWQENVRKASLGLVNSNNKLLTLLKLRFEIFKRDNFKCQYCGRNPKDDNCKLVLEHKIPKSKGGTFEPSNLTTACQECNLGKKDTLLNEKCLEKKNE
jgi:hypothetical protein